MEDQHLEQLLQDLSKDRAAAPSRFFSFKNRLRLYTKAFLLNFQAGAQQRSYGFKVASSMLIIVLTLTSGIGVYAYTSPEVNALSPFYPVKQSIEAVEYAFTNTPEEQVAFHRKQALRRLDEAEVIARTTKPAWQTRKEDVLKKTLHNIEENIELSLSYTPEQAEPESAKELLSTFHKDFEKINKQLKGMEKSEVKVEEKKSQENIKEVQLFMKDHMERMEKVSNEVDEAKDKKAKILLRQKLMKKRQEVLKTSRQEAEMKVLNPDIERNELLERQTDEQLKMERLQAERLRRFQEEQAKQRLNQLNESAYPNTLESVR